MSTFGQTINTFPYYYDFEGEIQGSTGAGDPYTMQTPFWVNASGDDGDWVADADGTISTSTGPSVDSDPGTTTGFYMYIEASTPMYPTKTAILESVDIDLSSANAMQFAFSYHMYGSTMGTLNVDVSDDNGSTWSTLWSKTGDQNDIWHRDTVDLSAYTGSTVKLRFHGTTGSSYYSDMAIDAVQLYDLMSTDAGIASIDSPSSPACSIGNSVYASIQNFGTDTLFNADIHWSINGVLQTPNSWSDTLLQFETESILVGNGTFADGDTIKVWTSNPNGSTEGINGVGNDSATVVIVEGMSGTYTIGTSGDFTTFNEAVDELIVRGVCGSTEFLVEDGTYNEQVTIPEIIGASSSSTITFNAQAGVNTNLILTYGASGTTDNWVLNLDGADHFIFRNIRMESTGTSYGRVLLLENEADSNHIDSCYIKGDQGISSTSTNMALLYSSSNDNVSHNLFTNNVFQNGSYGMYFYGNSSSDLAQGNQLINNWFLDQYYSGIRVYYQDSPVIRNNYVKLSGNYTTGSNYGIYVGYGDNNLEISGNRVSFSNRGYGMYIYYCDGTMINRGKIFNNSVSVGDSTSTSTTYGVYLTSSDYQDFEFNSINVVGDGTTTRGLYVSGTSNEIYSNNIVNNGSNGYAAYYSSGVDASDHNNYYAPNTDLIYSSGAYTTLTDFQTNTGFDLNSFSVDPVYPAWDTLTTCADELNNTGRTNPMITTDLDGEIRGTNPDIGAHEFEGIALFSVGADTSLCNNQILTLGDSTSTSSWTWSTGETTNIINVDGTDAGMIGVERISECGATQDTIEIVNIPDPVAGFTWSSSYVTGIFTNTSTGADSYSWDFGDGNTSTQENPTHVYNWKGEFVVTLTVTSDCGTSVFTDTINLDLVGVNELTKDNYTIYPNPTNGMVNISFSNTLTNGNVEIIDATGRVLQKAAVKTKQIALDLSSYENGFYFIRINNNDKTVTEKVVKK